MLPFIVKDRETRLEMLYTGAAEPQGGVGWTRPLYTAFPRGTPALHPDA